MSLRKFAGLVLALMVLLSARQAQAVSIAHFSFGSPTVTPSQATVDVLMDFSSESAADALQALALSVHGSDLTAGNTDFGRYSFVPGSPLSDWTALGDSLSIDGVETHLTFGTGTPINPGSYTIGQIVIDLTGLAANTPVVVILAGGAYIDATNTDVVGDITVGGDDLVGVVFSEDTGQDDAAFVTFGTPLTFIAPGGGTVIPEPATAALGLMGLMSLALASRRRR
jgi:hypothetical protein